MEDEPASAAQNDGGTRAANNCASSRGLIRVVAVAIVLVIYCYPSLKTRWLLGPTPLPPSMAPDLTLYLNLSNLTTLPGARVLNPYYLIPVPASGSAYLKFRLGPVLFNDLNEMLGRHLWLAMFTWNLLWWLLLCVPALWLFQRFKPLDLYIEVAGLWLLTLVNLGMAKVLIAAWIHASASSFQNVGLPFMRAFSPQIPIPLLLGYLGLQIGVLRGNRVYGWAGMAALQLLALATFPYATLMMVGITLTSALWMLSNDRGAWPRPLAYAAVCAVLDGAFLRRGSMNLYESHASVFHLQLGLLPHLAGGVWLLLCLLTIATVLSKTLPPEIKWPLIGLGAINLSLMLGDAVIPATFLLLSHHAGYFANTTAAVLLTFLAGGAAVRFREKAPRMRVAICILLGVLALNGMLVAEETYRKFLPLNRQQAGLTRLLNSLPQAAGDLFIARSLVVDDACGWSALLSRAPVLFCTDAEIMLTPPQNRDIQRVRQALYLYFSGKDSSYLQRIINDANPAGPMFQLGLWAEAVSSSKEEQNSGLRTIQQDLLPDLERVESHDVAVFDFLRQFRRVIVLDDLQNPAFPPDRLASFLERQEERRVDNWVAVSFTPK